MKNISQRGAVIALVLGILAVPAVVLASTALLDAGPAPSVELPSAPADPGREAFEQASAPATDEQPAVAPAEALAATDYGAGVKAADLDRACGPEGATLVAREASGDISPLQQAALDALRPICDEAGLPLTAPPASEPVVIVETVMTIPVQSSAPPVAAAGDDHEDDDHEDDDHEDDDHEDDDHEDED